MLSRPRILLLTTSLCLCACSNADGDPADDGALEPWQGQWRTGEGLFRDEALDPLYELVSGMRPDYQPDEIRELMIGTAEVDYDLVEVGGDTLTFVESGQPVCSGAYAFVDVHEGGHHGQTEFSLIEERAGDCTDYATVWLSDPIPSDPEVHFHVRTGRTDEPLRPPPWDPSAWTTSTTPEFFADLMYMAAPSIADALPEK